MSFDELPTPEEIKDIWDLVQIFFTIYRWGKGILLIIWNRIKWHGISKDAKDIAFAFYRFSWNNLQQTKPEIKTIGRIDRPEVSHILDKWKREYNSIILYGEAGSGKSGIANEIGQKLVLAGEPILFIRATDFPQTQDPILTLQNRLLIEIPLLKAIQKIGKERGLHIIIDQLDSVAGTDLGKHFVTFLKSITEFPNTNILVVTRTYELNNDPDIKTLDFNKVESGLLTRDKTIRYLSTLGLSDLSETLIEISSNLLNLSIISEIISDKSKLDYKIDSEVKLWNRYIDSIKEREGEEVVSFIENIARITSASGERDFLVRFPNSHTKRSVLSRGILLNAPGRRYKFRHNQIQDFLCAYFLLAEKPNLTRILTEFSGILPTQIISWLHKLYHEENLYQEEGNLVRGILGTSKVLPFYSRIIPLDVLRSQENPSNQVVEVLLDHRENHAYMKFFFNKLENPNWVGPLHRVGFFSNPPDIMEVEKGQIKAQDWPEGDYLLRFANDYEDIICSIVNEIQTRNWIVIKKLTELLIKISPEKATSIVSIVDSWLDNKWSLSMLPADLLPLADSFIESGYIEEATKILGYIIKPVFIGSESNLLDPEASLRFRADHYWVNEYINKQFPKLSNLDPIGLVNIFSLQLEEVINLIKPIKNEETEIYIGYYWRFDIQSSDSSSNSLDVIDILVDGLRDSLIIACTNSPDKERSLIKEYISNEHIIFQRIGLYILRQFGESNIDLINQSLKNKDFFDKDEFKFEYKGLLRDHFSVASKEIQNQVIDWILAGPPDIKDRASRYAQIEGRKEVTKEDRQKANDEWVQSYLSIIGGELPKEVSEKLLELNNQYGKRDFREKPTFEIGWQSAISPISSEELAKKSFEELQEYFLTYIPRDTFLDPREPLARDFKSIVQNNPSKYIDFTPYLINAEMPYIYIFNYLYGMTEAISRNEAKMTQSLLDLCDFLIDKEEDPFKKLKEILGQAY